MQLVNVSEEVQVVGGEQTSSFSIAMNGKAFRVLSDTLYKDKIGSIVRELSCNAYDAQVMNGNAAEPFVIHLPDNFEPWFSVQDKGIGLSPADIKNVFTKYFESTKTNNNDTIGAFGLGAKTPFSYTDQFTITSVKDGVCNIYSAYITASGIPDITLMMSSPSSEPTGVEIKMSVKSQDFYQFKNAVAQQLKHFNVKPVVENSPTFAFSAKPEAIYESKLIRLYPGPKSVTIIQGNVGYPLEFNNVQGKISDSTYRFLANLSCNIELLFPIGKIGVTASREGVEYNDFTCGNIERHILACQAEIEVFMKDQLSSAKNDYEKILLLSKTNVFGAENYLRIADIKIDHKMMNGKVYADLEKVLFRDKLNAESNKTYRARVFDCQSYTYFSKRINSVVGTFFDLTQDGVAYVVTDKISLINRRIRHLLDSPSVKHVYRFIVPAGESPTLFKQQLLVSLGGFTKVMLASEIVLPVHIAVRKKSAVTNYYVSNGTEYVESWYKEKEEEVEDITDRKAYVVVKRTKPSDKDVLLLRRINAYDKFEKPIGVIAIRETSVEDAENNPNLIKLEDYIKEVDNDPVKREEWRKRFALSTRASFVSDLLTSPVYSNLLQKMKDDCVPQNDLFKILDTIWTFKDIKSRDVSEYYKSANAGHFYGFFDSVVNLETKNKNRYSKLLDATMKKYPVVHALVYMGNSAIQMIGMDHLIEYINIMSKSKKV